jgi:predicted Zn-dependent protease
MDLARKATALRPDIVKNWERLASSHLFGTGEYEEAIAVLAEATSKFPTEPKLHLMLADAYYHVRRFDLACKVLHQVPVLDDQEAAIYRLELLMRTSDVKDADQAATDLLALDPTNIAALGVLGNVSRKTNRPEIMLPICQAALKQQPEHTLARYELAVTFTILGHTEEARKLIDIDRFVTATDVGTPQSYASAEEFEAALVSEINGNPTLQPDPAGKATRGGFQTMGSLAHAGEAAISDLLNVVRVAVDAFETNLTDELDHPLLKDGPSGLGSMPGR